MSDQSDDPIEDQNNEAEQVDFDTLSVDDDPNFDADGSESTAALSDTNLKNVVVELRVVVGETEMPLHHMLRMARGAVVPLETHADDDVRIYAGEVLIGRGQLKLNGENIEVVTTQADLRGAGFRAPSDRFKTKADAA